MRKLRQNTIARPVVLFLIVVLSAPALVIHHVHHIEASEPASHDSSTPGQTVNVPATYHETHVVTFLSGDSFNSSTRSDVVPSLHKFIATLAVVPVLSSTLSLSRIASVDIRPLSQLSGDKCVLFCSFLI
jgi:hypothetical protein